MDVAFPGVSAPFLFLLVALIVICAGTTARPAYAQQPLHLVNEQTTVRGVSFRFPETRTFEVDRLSDHVATTAPTFMDRVRRVVPFVRPRSEEHTSELQSRGHLVCRLLLEKKKT